MSTMDSLQRRLDKLVVLSKQRTYKHLPVRIYSEDDGRLLYETPLEQVRHKSVPYKVYLFDPDDDGSVE